MKKTVLILLASCLSILGYAQTFTLGGTTYEVISGTSNVNVVGYNTVAGSIVNIPQNVIYTPSGGKSSIYFVVGIGPAAFANKGITSLTLSEGLLSIDGNAFQGNSITNLVIPNSVTTIIYNAFKNNQIATLDLGSNITSIGNAAFEFNKITSLVLPNSVQTVGNSAFKDNLITYLTVESGVGNIGANAFFNNPVKSVTSLGITPPTLSTSAFNINGRDLIDLYIPDGTKAAYVTNSGAQWTGFKSVAEESFVIDYITYEVISTNPNTVSAVNYNVLGGPIVSIPATVTIALVSYDVTEIGEDAFKQKGLSSLTLSEGLVEINDRAFNANSITSLTIPNSVTYIGYNVFNYNQLATLDLGTGIEVIANGSFSYNNLTSIIIPSSMIAMGGAVFYDNDITTVTVKAGVGQLGFRTFWENPLTTVISESTTPPTITTGGTEETFSPDRSTIDLIIPSGTSGVYVTNSGALWTGFKSVTQDPVLYTSATENTNNQIQVYFTQNELKVFSIDKIVDYIIYNTSGAILSQNNLINNSIDISFLPCSTYLIKVSTAKGVFVQRFIKK